MDKGLMGMTLDSNDSLVATIDELIETFRVALLALVPVADRAFLNWSDMDTHPGWERVSVALFDTFVRGPIASDLSRGEHDFPLPGYDIDSTNLSKNSWIRVLTKCENSYVFVRFLSRIGPFDTVQVAAVDLESHQVGERLLFDVEDVNFSLLRRGVDAGDLIFGVEVND
jgi:hypothetical protein